MNLADIRRKAQKEAAAALREELASTPPEAPAATVAAAPWAPPAALLSSVAAAAAAEDDLEGAEGVYLEPSEALYLETPEALYLETPEELYLETPEELYQDAPPPMAASLSPSEPAESDRAGESPAPFTVARRTEDLMLVDQAEPPVDADPWDGAAEQAAQETLQQMSWHVSELPDQGEESAGSAAPSLPEVSAAPRETRGEPDALPVVVPLPVAVPLPASGFNPMGTILKGRELAFSGAEVAEEVDESAESLVELLCFKVASEEYAISIMDVKEIIRPRELTEVPRTPAFMGGILSLRGIIIPVFDLRVRLGLIRGERSRKERIVVVKRERDFCGVLVDQVVQVVRLALSGLEPPPVVLEGIDRDFVRGIGRVDGRMLILLDMEKVLDVTLS